MERIESLAHVPGPEGSKKLSGEEKYRIRQGNYCILYLIEDDRLCSQVGTEEGCIEVKAGIKWNRLTSL